MGKSCSKIMKSIQIWIEKLVNVQKLVETSQKFVKSGQKLVGKS
jgi:hypothetical protein